MDPVLKKLKKPATQATHTTRNKKKRLKLWPQPFCRNHINKVTDHVGKILKPNGIKTVYMSTKKIRDFLKPVKEHIHSCIQNSL